MGDVKVTTEELLEKAKKPAQDSLKMHPYYKGKIEVVPKCVIRDINDFAIWYTPGVAAPCMEINKDPEKVFQYTNKANMVGIVTDCTRVLGLGDIGPLAGLPVMEGKSLLFKYLGGVDAFPICLDTKDPEEIIKTVKFISPSFGGINLEDIANPKCFYVLDRLRAEASIPVWHDDQQGTAAVTLAGVINALKVVGKKIEDAKFTMIGIGAANVCITKMIIKAGADPKKFIVVDSKGILSRKRDDIKPTHKEKLRILPDHKRREQGWRHRRRDEGPGRGDSPFEAGARYHSESMGLPDGGQRNHIPLRQPDSRDVAVGCQRGGRPGSCHRPE